MRKVICLVILVAGLVSTIVWVARLLFDSSDGDSQSVAAPAQTYEELIKMFEYDRSAPLDLKENSSEEKDGAMVHEITYASPRGGRVTATLVTPHTTGREVGLIFAHGAGGRRRDFLPEAMLFAEVGAVSLLIDDPCARPSKWRRDIFDFDKPDQARAGFIQAIIDLRRGVDLLSARPDVDPNRLGFVGFSFGATLGGILCGVEQRIQAYALMGTVLRFTDFWQRRGLDAYIRATAPFNVVNYIGHASPAAVLYQFGRQDANVPEQDAIEFYRFGPEPKDIRWWDGGHQQNIEATRQRVEWFHTKLGSDLLDPALFKAKPSIVTYGLIIAVITFCLVKIFRRVKSSN
jgi:hypothetical protein